MYVYSDCTGTLLSHCLLSADFRGNGLPCPPTHTSSIAEDYSVKFFLPLLVEDECARKATIDNMSDFLLRPENEKLLRAHIPSIVRLATETPFEDITEGFQKLLQLVKVGSG